jgi:drug/metabolite transporter (DMT)-like permease
VTARTDREAVIEATGLIILSSCAFGSLSTLTVLVNRSGLPLLPAMLWRYLIAAGILLVILRHQRQLIIPRKDAIRLMLTGGLAQSTITFLSLHALNYLPVGPLAFLFYTYPAWVALIAAVTGRESLTLSRVIALAIAMSGIVVMVGLPSSGSLNRFGVLLALGTALLYALYLPTLHRVQQGIPALVSSFYLITGVFAAFFIASIVTGEIQIPHTIPLWGYVALLGIWSTIIAFASLVGGLRILGPVRTSIVATIEPFFTAVLGLLLLGEPVTRNTVMGGVLIALAVLIIQYTAPAEAEVNTA